MTQHDWDLYLLNALIIIAAIAATLLELKDIL